MMIYSPHHVIHLSVSSLTTFELCSVGLVVEGEEDPCILYTRVGYHIGF